MNQQKNYHQIHYIISSNLRNYRRARPLKCSCHNLPLIYNSAQAAAHAIKVGLWGSGIRVLAVGGSLMLSLFATGWGRFSKLEYPRLLPSKIAGNEGTEYVEYVDCADYV